MIREVVDATPATRAAFDDIIDVRSPAEFAHDHVPGAINLPVLSDAERSEVGTIYVQTSKFLARRLGAAYVARNIAQHVSGALSDRPASYAPLVYCWRGGQRSSAMAHVLAQVGWPVALLKGGYKTYRSYVADSLYAVDRPLSVVVIEGATGTGKTALLEAMAARGHQVLDLEALAAHRGSLFGDIAGTPQPSQKLFETRIAAALDGFDLSRPILVEAEASRIGDLRVPPRLWRAMNQAPEIELRAGLGLRVGRIVAMYGGLLDDPDPVIGLIERLPRHHGREERDRWIAMARAGDAAGLTRELIEAHYDPSYDRAATGHARRRLGAIDLDAAAADPFAAAAETLAGLLADRHEASGQSSSL